MITPSTQESMAQWQTKLQRSLKTAGTPAAAFQGQRKDGLGQAAHGDGAMPVSETPLVASRR